MVCVTEVRHGNGLVKVLQKYDVSRVHDFKFGFAKSATRFGEVTVVNGKTDFFGKAKVLKCCFDLTRDVFGGGRIHNECRLVKMSMPQK